MPKLLDSLGFNDNPFAAYVAENEPDIEQYFVRPPYFDDVSARGYACRSFVLFGARGAGKSATRMAFYKHCWTKWQTEGKGPLAVVLDDYTRVAPRGADAVDLGAFVSEVGYLTIEAILTWLSALSDEERALRLGTLTDVEEKLVVSLVQRFYLSRPDLVRSSTVREPLKLLNQAWLTRSKLWAEKRWDSVVGVISAIADGLAKKFSEDAISLDGGLKELLKADGAQLNDSLYAKALLLRFSELARAFGFSGVVILIDKVDESPSTSNSAQATAKLLYPLLSTTQLLEVDDFGWLFFVWDKVSQNYTGDLAIRLDKIAHANISWEKKYLRSMVAKRLSHYSDGRILEFKQLCEQSEQADAALDDVIELSMLSPRELIRVLDTVVREHDDQFRDEAGAPLLLRQSVDKALDKYAVETLPRMYRKTHIQQLIRLDKLILINKDVQGAFKIGEQPARAKIKAWEDAGLVARTGSRQADSTVGGKPAHEYSVVEERMKRIVSRHLSMGPEFDGALDEDVTEALDVGNQVDKEEARVQVSDPNP